jgi:CRISPR-associated endonuclease/helicase Cas3
VLNEESYRSYFRHLTSLPPHAYQVEVARLLFEGHHVLLRAPTGAGKTLSVLAPFLCDEWPTRPAHLIYALPLRTLAQGIYREAREVASKIGAPVEAIIENGREVVSPFVTLQTGEQADDPFFDRGKIIVTTYDQLLSGLLCGPYSLSGRLHNVNAAAVAGALVVFDEFHLMPPDKAFLTAAAALKAFRNFCQSVWMTATATVPLEETLRASLNAATVPDSDASMLKMLQSLPSVNSVTRTLIPERGMLTADHVLRHHEQRSIALANTVGRAQNLFEELRTKLANRPDVRLILLHSRFFTNDRQGKEALLKSLFAKETHESAILVATQVIEAGIDISCEHLHSELCPMNALIQRAGRCARFSGQTGAVHVYELPPDRGWLPYGTPQEPDPSIDATRNLLWASGQVKLDPVLAAKWVDTVHRKTDEHAVRSGVKERTNRLLDTIHRNAIQRDPADIAHLIRGDDSESIRVVVCDEAHRPASPGKLESISMSRWSLVRYLSPQYSIGWYWDGDELQPWKPLSDRNDLARTYAVALRPEFAAYDREVGLRLAQPGNQQSPARTEPPRPGYAPLKEESWANHARKVASVAETRLGRDGFPHGIISHGFQETYGLTAEHLRVAARTCGLLHDLGKLQSRWQQWARAWQSSKDPHYKFVAPLAHTDFNPDNDADRIRQRSLDVRRPSHAAASAYYSCSLLDSALNGIPEELLGEVASACAAAIIAHHGAFIPKTANIDLGILALSKDWERIVSECAAYTPNPEIIGPLLSERDRRGHLEQFLEMTTGRSNLERWWPLVSYLTRTLRLSDQRATSEWACSE